MDVKVNSASFSTGKQFYVANRPQHRKMAPLRALLAAEEVQWRAEVSAWIVIQPDNRVLIRVAHSEMGQGIFTALAVLIAEELVCDLDPAQIAARRPLLRKDHCN